jgi:hypothetical protein
MLFGKKRSSSTRIFDSGILSTFGKLDETDIAKIGGRSDRLVAALVLYYGWSSIDAQRRVDDFLVSLF